MAIPEIDDETQYATYKKLKGEGYGSKMLVAYFGPRDAAIYELRLEAEVCIGKIGYEASDGDMDGTAYKAEAHEEMERMFPKGEHD